jgi:GR25 family glycosyltransferase involved in LPS biosynthesis
MYLRDFFDCCLVINLARRPDRWRRIREELARVGGPEAIRIDAVDGRDPETAAAWRDYAARPRDAGRPTSVRSNLDFFTKGASRLDRLRHALATRPEPPIASAGAFAYLASYRRALETAIATGADPVLILDDDCLFHRRTWVLLDYVDRQLPGDWTILQLGSLQFDWSDRWATRVSRNLYANNGATIGSHAVAYRRSAMEEILASFDPVVLPYDIGALSEYVQAHRRHCFVAYPNIAVQTLEDTDIGTSSHHGTDADTRARLLRWRMADYR